MAVTMDKKKPLPGPRTCTAEQFAAMLNIDARRNRRRRKRHKRANRGIPADAPVFLCIFSVFPADLLRVHERIRRELRAVEVG